MEGISVFGGNTLLFKGETLRVASVDPQIEPIDNSLEVIFNKISNQFLLPLLSAGKIPFPFPTGREAPTRLR